MLVASVSGNTDTGLVRKNNEDAFIAQKIWDDNHWLLVVIDGLGGYEGGEVAASIAKDTILQSVDGKQGMDCLDVIMQSVADANNAIFKKRSSAEELRDMGCVITASILDLVKKQLNVAHVGDTRLYQCDANGLVKLTHDHSFVGGLEDGGHISEVDAMNHPRRNLIDRIVGDELKDSESPRFIEAAIFSVVKGSQYLLCSDGLSDMLTSTEMNSILQKDVSVTKKVGQLLDFANKQGGKDNITAIVVNVVSELDPKNISRKNSPVEKKSKKRKNKKKKQKIIKNTEILSDKKEKINIFKIGVITLMIVVVFLMFIILSHSNI